MPETKPDQLILPRPDDWHVHLRDGDLLAETVPATARVFGRAIVTDKLPSQISCSQIRSR